MTTIAVVDHGAGNLVSIAQGLERAGARVVVAATPAELESAQGIVLPGVGSTGAVMAGIRRGGFVDALRSRRVPLLGICVGMQVLFDHSDEDATSGLGLIPGRVRRLAARRLPHIGWNDVTVVRPDPLFAGTDPVFYFVHSYAPVCDDVDHVVARCEYGEPFVAAVRAGTVAGVQFHPERSATAGLRLLSNFVASCRTAVEAVP